MMIVAIALLLAAAVGTNAAAPVAASCVAVLCSRRLRPCGHDVCWCA